MGTCLKDSRYQKEFTIHLLMQIDSLSVSLVLGVQTRNHRLVLTFDYVCHLLLY
jgi:hypothetical protein